MIDWLTDITTCVATGRILRYASWYSLIKETKRNKREKKQQQSVAIQRIFYNEHFSAELHNSVQLISFHYRCGAGHRRNHCDTYDSEQSTVPICRHERLRCWILTIKHNQISAHNNCVFWQEAQCQTKPQVFSRLPKLVVQINSTLFAK